MEEQKKSLAVAVIENNLLMPSRNLVFIERVWGFKNNEELKFDMSNYSVQELLALSERFSDQIHTLYSDTQIEYFSDGSRYIRKVSPLSIIENRMSYVKDKNAYGNKTYFIPMKKAKLLFPTKVEWLESLEKAYPTIKNWRFMTDDGFEKLELAMNIEGASIVSFRECWANIRNNDSWPFKFSSLGNLNPGFKMFSKVIQLNAVKELDEREDFNTINVRCGFEPKCDDDDEYRSSKLENRKGRVSMYVGYAGIPYNVAMQSCNDPKALKREMVKEENDGKFNITYSGKLISGKCNEFKFDKELGCCPDQQLILDPKTFEKWAEDFTADEMATITRKRSFAYINPDHTYMKGIISGKIDALRKNPAFRSWAAIGIAVASMVGLMTWLF